MKTQMIFWRNVCKFLRETIRTNGCISGIIKTCFILGYIIKEWLFIQVFIIFIKWNFTVIKGLNIIYNNYIGKLTKNCKNLINERKPRTNMFLNFPLLIIYKLTLETCKKVLKKNGETFFQTGRWRCNTQKYVTIKFT